MRKQFEVHSELKEQQLNLDISIFLEVLENLIDNAMRFRFSVFVWSFATLNPY